MASCLSLSLKGNLSMYSWQPGIQRSSDICLLNAWLLFKITLGGGATHMPQCTCGPQKKLASASLSAAWVSGLNSLLYIWWQVWLPTEPSHVPVCGCWASAIWVLTLLSHLVCLSLCGAGHPWSGSSHFAWYAGTLLTAISPGFGFFDVLFFFAFFF